MEHLRLPRYLCSVANISNLADSNLNTGNYNRTAKKASMHPSAASHLGSRRRKQEETIVLTREFQEDKSYNELIEILGEENLRLSND
jgi:hypothetical protein